MFTIDTGRQPQETYNLIDKIRDRYGIKIEIFLPDSTIIQQMVTKHGNNLFYRDVNLRLLCCQVRKVLPLRKALMNFSAWVTGLRRDQWATRSNIRKVEIDHDHGGIVKLAPLADWTEDEVWDYIQRQRRSLQRALRQGLSSRSDARPARARSPKARTPAPADGGGRPARPKNAACTARSRPAASSTSSAALLGETAHPTTNAVVNLRHPRRFDRRAIKLDAIQREALLAEIEQDAGGPVLAGVARTHTNG